MFDHWDRGKREGMSYEYYYSGQLKKTVTYHRGLLHGIAESFNEKGFLIERIFHQKGDVYKKYSFLNGKAQLVYSSNLRSLEKSFEKTTTKENINELPDEWGKDEPFPEEKKRDRP